MELVAGEPITDHCDRHDLDIRRRLELFVGVCRGVQHAHQKGVPVPTIIDFGIAKAVESRVDGDGFATALASDIERHLGNKPIVARLSTLGYTAAKFVRRHRLGVSVLVTAAAALIVGLARIARESSV